jgi:hypothetical protein
MIEAPPTSLASGASEFKARLSMRAGAESTKLWVLKDRRAVKAAAMILRDTILGMFFLGRSGGRGGGGDEWYRAFALRGKKKKQKRLCRLYSG